jgi:purine-binding chemotaxis protein CheW
MSELYVVFSVADSEYAVAAASVRQLESYQGATPVPGAAAHVAGIIQIRGQVIPVVDLRQLFGHPSVEPTLNTRVVVIEHGERRVGLIVDKSREILRIDRESVQSSPALVQQSSGGLLEGLVQLGTRLLMLLDLRKVVGEEQLNVEFPKQLESRVTGPAKLPGQSAAGIAGSDGDARPEH